MSSRARVATAYLLLCVVWGSTYLAIRVGVQHLPPAVLGGIRFVVAGGLLFVVARAMGGRPPRGVRDWRTNVIVGVMLLGLANGLLIWAEQFVTSGAASVYVVTVSLWLAVFDALIPGSRSRPTPLQFVALLVGFGGTLLLVGASVEELLAADWRGPLALTGSAAVWSLGSIVAQRQSPRTGGPYMNSAIQQLAGGIFLLLVATGAGEWSRVRMSWPGGLAVAYLIVFGSVVGFTSYVYVLRHMSATVAGTYVYANTVVAVFLGWALLGEPVTVRTLLAMAIVIGSVAWVRAARRRPDEGTGSEGGDDASPSEPRMETAEST